MITVVIEDSEVRRLLADAERRAKDMAPAWHTAGEILMDRVERNFSGEVAGTGERWEPLAYSTLVGRVTEHGKLWTKRGKLTAHAGRVLSGHRILVQSGALKGSITFRAYKDRVEIGSNKVYAAIHQFGGMAGRGRKTKIPARTYVTVDEPDIRAIEKALSDYVTQG